MRRIRRSRHNKSKAIYVVFVCFVTALVFFFSVGYAVYSDRLLVGGRAYITSVVEGYSCHVKNLEGEVLDGLTINNTIWDNQNGSVEIILNNASSESLEHFTILFEIPEGFEIMSGWGGDYIEKDGFAVITQASYSRSLASQETFTHTFTYRHEADDSFKGFTLDQVIALKDEEGTTYDCENRNWMVNGELNGSDDGFDETINNLLLTYLAVDGYDISPKFTPGVTDYTVNIFGDVSQVNITATAQEVTNIITGIGPVTLKEGKNYFDIVITNYRGLTKTYKLTIGRYSERAEPGATINIDGVVVSYADTYANGREHQFKIDIQNTKDVDITNWVLAADLGMNAEVTGIWCNIAHEFNPDTGLIEFYFNAANSNIESEVISPGEIVTLYGQYYGDNQPQFIYISYD